MRNGLAIEVRTALGEAGDGRGVGSVGPPEHTLSPRDDIVDTLVVHGVVAVAVAAVMRRGHVCASHAP